MAHILARHRGAPAEDIKAILERDAPEHAAQGLYLEHLWQDDGAEVLFLFRVDDLDRAREFIETVHREARQTDPDANLPEMTFLEEI
jgi:hypothetical protein